MTKYLITPSLLGSFAWYLSDESENNREKFLLTLKREKTPTTEAQAKGIRFEDDISLACADKYPYLIWMGDEGEDDEKRASYDAIVSQVCDIVRGGLWQQSIKKEIKVGNQEFLLYGRTDVIKRDTIYDIKFTSNYELGKFLDSSQHLIYLYCSDLPNFSYLISDGKEFWREDYHNHAGIENEIKSKISDFLGYLENDKEAKEMFLTKWESKNNNNA